MTLLLGIDEGTSAVKAILFDQELRPLREARRSKALRHPRPGWVEQDPEEVLQAVVEALQDRPEVDARRVGVIGFCMGGTYALQLACVNGDLRAAFG